MVGVDVDDVSVTQVDSRAVTHVLLTQRNQFDKEKHPEAGRNFCYPSSQVVSVRNSRD